MSEILNRAVTKGWGPGAGIFPRVQWAWPLSIFVGNKKKMKPKELLGYSFPHLLIANTWQLETKLMLGFLSIKPLPWHSILACQKDFQVWFLPLPFRICPSWWKLLQTIIMEMIGLYFWLTSQKTQNPTIGNVLSATVVRKH